jgi:hypothetical protein
MNAESEISPLFKVEIQFSDKEGNNLLFFKEFCANSGKVLTKRKKGIKIRNRIVHT